MYAKTKQLISHFANDSLYRNSLYLILSTAVMSFFGFFFWVINAKLYSTEQIGLATALISLTALLNGFSLLGLNAGLVRFLPLHPNRDELISTVLTLVGVVSIIITAFYVGFINIFSPSLLFIKTDLFFAFFFTIFVALSAINMMTDSIFLALKTTKYIFIYNSLYSITRLLLPVLLVSFGAMGIFLAHSFGVIICLFLTLYFLYTKFKYTFKFTIHLNIIQEIGKFSFGNYFANFIGGLPSALFPLIILNQLGAKASAYYYMDMMIVGLLYMVPISISQSLFAESSHEEHKLKEFIIKSLKLNALLLIPAIVVILIAGKYVLLVFGKDYSIEGVGFLNLMALSSLTVPFNYILGVYFKILKKTKYITIVAAIGAVVTLTSSYVLLHYGLLGIGWGLIIGQIAQIIFYALILSYLKTKN